MRGVVKLNPHEQTSATLDDMLKEAITCPLCNTDGKIYISNIETGECTNICMFCGYNTHNEIAVDKEKDYLVKYAEYLLWNKGLDDSLKILQNLDVYNSEMLDDIWTDPDEDKVINFIDKIQTNKKSIIPQIEDRNNFKYETKSYGGYGIIHLTNDSDNSIDPTDSDNTCLDGKICIRDNDKSNMMTNDEYVTTYHLFGNPSTGVTSLVQLVNNTIVYSMPLSADKYYNEMMEKEMEKMQERGTRATLFLKLRNDIIEV